MLELKNSTEQLLTELKHLKLRYESSSKPKDKNDKAFFNFVKEKTMPIYDLLENWERQAMHATQHRTINVHVKQIISTKENMELILLHSYYVDARRKPYMELNQACFYVFNQVLNDIKKGGNV